MSWEMQGHSYANYFSKTYIVRHYITEKWKKNHRLVSWQNPVKADPPPPPPPPHTKKIHPVPAASTAGPSPTIICLLLRFYNNVCRRNGNCVDPNQTDSLRAS